MARQSSSDGRWQIYLILATQRPSSEAVDVKVRTNLGNRLVLKVPDANNSKIALGSDALQAERLEGNGHIICKVAEGVTRGQVPFLNPRTMEVYDFVEQIAKKWI